MKKEIYCGFDMTEFNRVRDALYRAGIDHTHKSSEQIWYAVKGKGQLLLGDDKTADFAEGDVARFADGDVHGLCNNSDTEFVYISVTSPPIDFGYAYKDKK